MEKVPLWRTARLGMVTYQPDGLGRDKYIKYNNGGFWDTGEKFEIKQDYERPKDEKDENEENEEKDDVNMLIFKKKKNETGRNINLYEQKSGNDNNFKKKKF